MRSTVLRRFLTLALIVAAAFILPGRWSAALRDYAIRTVRPVGHALIVSNSSLYNGYNNFRQLSTLRSDKTALEARVLQLQKESADKERLVRENALLQKEVGVTGVTRDTRKVLGHVVLKDVDGADGTLTLDIGTAEGAEVGQAAVSQGALVGRVIAVTAHSCVVRKLTSQKSRILVWLAENREKGFLSGTGTGVQLIDITQGVTVHDPAVIETSGLGGTLPQGIIVGETAGLRSKQSDLSQVFAVKLAQNVDSLESIFVLVGR